MPHGGRKHPTLPGAFLGIRYPLRRGNPQDTYHQIDRLYSGCPSRANQDATQTATSAVWAKKGIQKKNGTQMVVLMSANGAPELPGYTPLSRLNRPTPRPTTGSAINASSRGVSIIVWPMLLIKPVAIRNREPAPSKSV